MLGKKVGIDLGSSMVRVVVKGDGLVFEEPSLVAMSVAGTQVSAFGAAGLRAAHQDEGLAVRRPLRGSEITDPVALAALLSHVLNRSIGRQRIFKPDLVVAIHSATSGVDRRRLLDMLAASNARTIYLLDAPIAAGLGAGAALVHNNGHLVIDLGAECFEVAAVAAEGTVAGRYVPVGLRSLRPPDVPLDIHDAAVDEGRRDALVRDVINAAREVLMEIPSALRRDIQVEGVILVGGGAQVPSLADPICDALGLKRAPITDPHLCAAKGAGIAVDSLDLLRRSFLYIR